MVVRTGSSNSCLLEGMDSVKSRDSFECHSSGAEYVGDRLSWAVFIKASTPGRDWRGWQGAAQWDSEKDFVSISEVGGIFVR